MKVRSYLAAASLFIMFMPCSMTAQSNELSLSFGAAISPNAKVTPFCEAILTCPAGPVTKSINLAFAVEGGFAHRVVNAHVASLYVETPFLISPDNSGLFSNDFSRLIFTPSVRVKFLPGNGISPFLSGGGGFSRLSSGGTSGITGAFQFGGGIDFRTPLPRLAVRVEARDFVSGNPSGVLGGVVSNHLQNVFAGAGVVIHF